MLTFSAYTLPRTYLQKANKSSKPARMTLDFPENPAMAAPAACETIRESAVTAQTIQVAVHTDASDSLTAWEELEAVAPASIYQTRRFAIPWYATMGAANNLHPLIAVVSNCDGAPLALFPLALRQGSAISVIEYVGGKDSNTNMPLIRPGVIFSPSTIEHVLREIAAKAPGRPDLFILKNQPHDWEGTVNPLRQLPSQNSPSHCHSTYLLADSEEFRKQRLSADARKKLRAKTRKLGELGPLTFMTARTKDEAARILEAFYAQKRQRFDDKNISSGFDSPESRSFFARTCISRIGERETSVELHALVCGDRIIATYGGGVHRKRFHGMFNSFDSASNCARFSPGDVLLAMLIEAKCRQGLKMFDLGIGEGRYKQSWCDRSEVLFDTIFGLTIKGKVWAQLEASGQSLKRSVKQSKWAWPLIAKLRESIRLS